MLSLHVCVHPISSYAMMCLIAHGTSIMKYKCSLINRYIQWVGYYGPASAVIMYW